MLLTCYKPATQVEPGEVKVYSCPYKGEVWQQKPLSSTGGAGEQVWVQFWWGWEPRTNQYASVGPSTEPRSFCFSPWMKCDWSENPSESHMMEAELKGPISRSPRGGRRVSWEAQNPLVKPSVLCLNIVMSECLRERAVRPVPHPLSCSQSEQRLISIAPGPQRSDTYK